MKFRKILFLILFFGFTNIHFAQNSTAFFELTDVFLKKYVDENNKVDYKSLKKNSDMLNIIVDYAAKLNIKEESKESNKAFWINVYNLTVIKDVLTNYPIKSTIDVDGFFKETEFLIASQTLTLDDIENTILREIFLDPGIHFVLVAAANGGAPLLNHAYKPENIDGQIREQASKCINNSTFVRIDKREKTIDLPKIFEWYNKDFVTYYTNEVDFLNIFLEKKLPKDYRIRIYDYDWSLNQQ